MVQGRQARALAVLRRAAELNGKDANQLFPDDESFQLTTSESRHRCSSSSGNGTASTTFSVLWEVFSCRWRFVTALVWTVWVGSSIAYYGSIALTNDLSASSSSPSPCNDNDNCNKGTTIEDTNVPAATAAEENLVRIGYTGLVISSAAEVAGLTVIIFFVERIGRVRCLALCFALGGLLVFVLGVVVHMDKFTGGENGKSDDHGKCPFRSFRDCF